MKLKVSDLRPEFLFGLARWTQQSGSLSPAEYRHLYDAGLTRTQGWPLSEKQERLVCTCVHKLAKASPLNQFDPILGQTDGPAISPVEHYIGVLDLNSRVYNALTRAGITTLSELMSLSDKEILKFKQLGAVGLTHIKEKLSTYLDEDLSNDENTSHLAEAKVIENCGATSCKGTSPLTISESMDILLTATCNQTQELVLRRYYGIDNGIPQALKHIGRVIGIPIGRVKQLHDNVLKTLQLNPYDRLLEDVALPFQAVFRYAREVLKDRTIAKRVSDIVVVGPIDLFGVTRFVLEVSPAFEKTGPHKWRLNSLTASRPADQNHLKRGQ